MQIRLLVMTINFFGYQLLAISFQPLAFDFSTAQRDLRGRLIFDYPDFLGTGYMGACTNKETLNRWVCGDKPPQKKR